MDEMRKPASLISRFLRAFGVSVGASVLSVFAGLFAFWAFAFLLAGIFGPGGLQDLPIDGPNLSLAYFNTLPVALIAGFVSFGAQMRDGPVKALRQGMTLLLALLQVVLAVGVVAAIYLNGGLGRGLTDLIYLICAVVPCVFAVVIHWALVNARISSPV